MRYCCPLTLSDAIYPPERSNEDVPAQYREEDNGSWRNNNREKGRREVKVSRRFPFSTKRG